MKIASWNVNGLRSVINGGYDTLIADNTYDIVCIQEVKMQEDLFTDFLYRPKVAYWSCAVRSGYSGVATIISQDLRPLEVRKGMGDRELDKEGRVLTIEFESFIIVNVYAPHSHRRLLRLREKERFIEKFIQLVNNLRKLGKPIFIAGDLNAAHQEIDLHHYRTNKGNAGFLPQERQWIQDLLSLGFVDAFRFLYPEKRQYSWWGLTHDLRRRDIGWRIDYILVDASLGSQIRNCLYIKEQLGSDHCPVMVDVNF